MKRNVFLLGLAALCAGCSTPGQPGSVTIEGRGAGALSQRGDPLMDTGQYAKKVPKEYAMGYAKGISDAGWREYWRMQDQQAIPRQTPSNGGHINYYPVTIPEGTDGDGVNHAPREVVVPIVEFISRKGSL